jgi:hypothetical protein
MGSDQLCQLSKHVTKARPRAGPRRKRDSKVISDSALSRKPITATMRPRRSGTSPKKSLRQTRQHSLDWNLPTAPSNQRHPSASGQSLPKWALEAMYAFPPIVTRCCRSCRRGHRRQDVGKIGAEALCDSTVGNPAILDDVAQESSRDKVWIVASERTCQEVRFVPNGDVARLEMKEAAN